MHVTSRYLFCITGYPQIPAASLALNTVRKFLETHATDVGIHCRYNFLIYYIFYGC